MKVDFDGYRKQTAGAFNAVARLANNATLYEGHLLVNPDELANTLSWLRGCISTLLCLEGDGFASIVETTPLIDVEIESDDDLDIEDELDEDDDDLNTEDDDTEECDECGFLNGRHHPECTNDDHPDY